MPGDILSGNPSPGCSLQADPLPAHTSLARSLPAYASLVRSLPAHASSARSLSMSPSVVFAADRSDSEDQTIDWDSPNDWDSSNKTNKKDEPDKTNKANQTKGTPSSCSGNLKTTKPKARDYGGTMWKLEGSRKYEGESYGSWAIGIRAKADGGPGDSISMSASKSVSNSISGNVGIPLKKLNASFQFNVSKQWSASASKSYGLTGKRKGSWWAIQYKRIYNNYKIKARQYSFYDGTWHKTTNTRWVRAKRFSHFAYQLCPSSAPN